MAAVLVALALAHAVAVAAAPATMSPWAAAAAASVLTSGVARRANTNCPVSASGFTDLASLIGIADAQEVSSVANCIAQDGSSLRAGRLVQPAQSSVQYCCVESGVATTVIDVTVCSTGCDNQLHSSTGFFVDPLTDRCYQRCFETPSELCALGEIAAPTLLDLDTAAIATSNPLLVNMFCPYNQQALQAYLLGPADATPAATGYGIDLSSDSCSSISPIMTVCRGRGTVIQSGNSALCLANLCGLTYPEFVGLTDNPNDPPVPGIPCFYDCAVEPTTCIGYSSDCNFGFFACTGQYAFSGIVTSANDANACASAVCWTGGSNYNGYSYGGSGILACPPTK